MSFYLNHFMEIWLLPPGNLLIFLIIGFLFKDFLLGKSLLIIAIIGYWVLSMPIVANLLLENLQNRYSTLLTDTLKNDEKAAIVVLEAGLNLINPEYNKPIVSENTLSRIRYAAFLHHITKAPLLVSGNDPTSKQIDHAKQMADCLQDYFGITARWKDSFGYNTAQEGIISSEILRQAGIKKIYLVTSALHMPRAVYSFQHKGLDVIPAPTGYKNASSSLGTYFDLLPSINALTLSTSALREYLGLAWYKIFYRFK